MIEMMRFVMEMLGVFVASFVMNYVIFEGLSRIVKIIRRMIKKCTL